MGVYEEYLKSKDGGEEGPKDNGISPTSREEEKA